MTSVDNFQLFNDSSVVFQDPWWLVLLPLAIMPWVLDRRLKKFFPIASARVMLPMVVRPKRSLLTHSGWILRGFVLFVVIVALARPQFGYLPSIRSTEGVDILLAIDTSGSMRARDFEVNGQRPDRLDVIKAVIQNFISERPDDRIGVVVFGSESYTQSPLTLDHDVLAQFIDRIEIGMAGDGTAIGDGLALAVKRLKNSPDKSRVVVLLTDGANNSGRIDPLAAARAAKALSIKVHTIGVGSQGVVPIVQNGRVFHIQADIDEKTLQDIAAETGGQYWRASDTNALLGVYRDIDRLEKIKRDQKEKRQGRDVFPLFIAASLIALTMEVIWRMSRFRRLPA